jgi:alcohol dehydrogenase class IV
MAFIEFQVPTNIIYGNDSLQRIAELAAPNQEKVVIVAEKLATERGLTSRIKRLIEGYAYDVIIYEIPTLADTKDLFEGVNIAKSGRADVVIGIGGQNVLSIAKYIAQFSTQELSKEEQRSHKRFSLKKVKYIEVPSIQSISWGLLPMGYIIDETDKIKKPYADKDSIAYALIIDPVITEETPLNEVIFSSIESMAYSFDAYISKKSTPLSDSFSLKAIEYLSVNLRRLALEPANNKIKGNLSMGALLASLAVGTSSLGMSAACAMALETAAGLEQSKGASIILPHVMEFNLTAAANKFIQVALALGEKVADITVIEAAIMGIESMRRLMLDLHVPVRLSDFNVTQDKLDNTAKIGAQYDFLSFIPRPAGRNEMFEVFSAAL